MDKNNLFDHFSDEIKSIFSLDSIIVEKIIQLFNEKNKDVSIIDFSEITGLNANESEKNLSGIATICHYNIIHKDEFEKDFKSTILEDSFKKELKKFLEKLSDKGIEGLDIRFYIKQSSIDDPVLNDLTQSTFLKEIYDDDEKLICYLPIIRLKFSFERDGKESIRYGYFPQEQLKILINSLKKVYEQSSKSVERYRNVKESEFPIIGEKNE